MFQSEVTTTTSRRRYSKNVKPKRVKVENSSGVSYSDEELFILCSLWGKRSSVYISDFIYEKLKIRRSTRALCSRVSKLKKNEEFEQYCKPETELNFSSIRTCPHENATVKTCIGCLYNDVGFCTKTKRFCYNARQVA